MRVTTFTLVDLHIYSVMCRPLSRNLNNLVCVALPFPHRKRSRSVCAGRLALRGGSQRSAEDGVTRPLTAKKEATERGVEPSLANVRIDWRIWAHLRQTLGASVNDGDVSRSRR